MSEGAAAFEHDCDTCVFLGRFEGNDLYFHDGGDLPVLTTVIARYGPDGQYVSGLPLVPYDVRIAEARVRAVAAGLLAAS